MDLRDVETDFLVVGACVARLSATITARRSGLDTILVESTDRWGGTTTISGGGLWMPNNPLMAADRAGDSIEAVLEYMKLTFAPAAVFGFLGALHAVEQVQQAANPAAAH
jgi:3-oxosteroid 1-dehydrogenase